jgi:hypothetical protein
MTPGQFFLSQIRSETMTKWFLSAALILSAFPSTAIAQTKESLVGTWKLVSITETTEKGGVTNPAGQHPTGFLTYTADGRVSVIIIPDGRKPLITAYAGSYTFTGDKVIHHIEAAWPQNLASLDLVRSVKLEGDRLTLIREPLVHQGVPVPYREFAWERLKPNTAGK